MKAAGVKSPAKPSIFNQGITFCNTVACYRLLRIVVCARSRVLPQPSSRCNDRNWPNLSGPSECKCRCCKLNQYEARLLQWVWRFLLRHGLPDITSNADCSNGWFSLQTSTVAISRRGGLLFGRCPFRLILVKTELTIKRDTLLYILQLGNDVFSTGPNDHWRSKMDLATSVSVADCYHRLIAADIAVRVGSDTRRGQKGIFI
jgi:hypothetical protein